jgi:hypothetical protein
VKAKGEGSTVDRQSKGDEDKDEGMTSRVQASIIKLQGSKFSKPVNSHSSASYCMMLDAK